MAPMTSCLSTTPSTTNLASMTYFGLDFSFEPMWFHFYFLHHPYRRRTFSSRCVHLGMTESNPVVNAGITQPRHEVVPFALR